MFTTKPKEAATGPRLMIITEYAHATKSGVSINESKILDEALKNTKFPYVFITPMVKCNLGKAPTKPLIECCEEYLREEIKLLKPNIIICIGKGPASVFNISGRIDKLKMGAYQLGDTKVIVTYPFDKVEEAYKYRLEFFKAFAKANRFVDDTGEVEVNYEMFENALEFSNWVDIAIKEKATLAADIECTGLDYFAEDAAVRTIAFSPRAGRAVVVPYNDTYREPLKRLLESEFTDFVFHNATFDMSYLRVVLGIQVKNLAGDTMLMAYLLNPGLGKYGYGLKPLSNEWTDLGSYDTDIGDDWKTMGLTKLATYNCCDADATLRLYTLFFAQLEEQEMLASNKLVSDATHVICDLQINGVKIDDGFVQDTIPKMEALIAQYSATLTELAGGAYDWNSPKELDKLLYDILKYSRPDVMFKETATDDDALDRIGTPFTDCLRKYRKATKLLGTYFQGYFSKIGRDGRLHAEYNLHGTRTGRLSSDNPNFQNLPRGIGKDDPGYEDLYAYKVKNAIVANPGWVLVSADQSQVELRVAAMVSKDQDLMDIYLNKLDMHSANAIISFSMEIPLVQGPDEDLITFTRRQHQWVKDNKDTERTASKEISFGTLYGMREGGLKFALDAKTRSKGKVWSRDECKAFLDKFADKYATLSQWIKRTQRKAEQTGYAITVFGRRRPLPELKHKEWYERIKGLRMAVNTPIQSGAADILMLGLINLRQRMDPTRAKLIMTVHDSIVLEVREDYVEELMPIMKDCMENPLFCGKPLPFLNIPLLAEFEIGPKYGSLKKVK